MTQQKKARSTRVFRFPRFCFVHWPEDLGKKPMSDSLAQLWMWLSKFLPGNDEVIQDIIKGALVASALAAAGGLIRFFVHRKKTAHQLQPEPSTATIETAEKPPRIAKFQGTWKETPYREWALSLDLTIAPDNSCAGAIKWTLIRERANGQFKASLGKPFVETVIGSYRTSDRTIMINGQKIEPDTMDLGSYEIRLSENYRRFEITWSTGGDFTQGGGDVQLREVLPA